MSLVAGRVTACPREDPAVPVTFENSPTVTVRAPDGHWYEVRIVADDGHRRWPTWLSPSPGLGVVVAMYGVYRLILRAGYAIRRSSRKSVEVLPWPDGVRPPDRARPVHRESLPDDATARARATALVQALRRGELIW